jgi:cyanophycinase
MQPFNNFSQNSNKKGFLVLIGGAEDKKNEKTILKKIVGLNNANNAIIIPTASCYPKGIAEDYFYAFSALGVKNVSILDIREKHEAELTEYFEKIEQADMIFFTGGDQFRLANILNETVLLQKIKERHLKGATIAGTSAGAAVACDPIIYDGDNLSLCKGTIHHSKGFGFINNITIDTHFVNRGRLGRLTQFLCSGYHTKGIGIGEDTAIFIDQNDIFEVVGSEMITVVNTADVSYSNYNQIHENDKIVIQDIRIGFLQSGSTFDTKEWKIISSNETKSMVSEETFPCNNPHLSYYTKKLNLL